MSSKRTNSQKQVFADHVKERMALFGPVDIRPMFGGFGIYRQGLMFALIADERLYFKTDDLSQPQFEARGLTPFTYEANGHVSRLRYHEAPPEVFDEPHDMAAWARLGHECAVRQAALKQAAKTARKTGKATQTAGKAPKKAGARAGPKASSQDEAAAGAPARPAKSAEDLAGLPNLGPKSVEMLAKAGIRTPAQLRRLGAVRAYLKVKAKSPTASLNLLWAIEGALTGRDWREVAEVDRASLLMALEDASGAAK